MSVADGLMLGFLADRLFGDPRRGHPVAGFGAMAAALERSSYRDAHWAGAAHTGLLVGGAATLGALAGRGGTLAVAVGTWTVLGGTSLAATGERMANLLDEGDLGAARALLPALCGRDPDLLDTDGLARAALESVAENTSDAVVGPLFWGAVAGLPGLLGYRAVNTLDAMIGYRSPRYRRFGWAAARLDDVANYLPARVTGLLTVVLAPLVEGRPAAAWSAWQTDAAEHPSPNAGVVEAATAGALGVQLGGRTEYRHGVEQRPRLGSGRPPAITDLRRAVRLSRLVQAGAVVGSAGLAVAVGQLRRRGQRR